MLTWRAPRWMYVPAAAAHVLTVFFNARREAWGPANAGRVPSLSLGSVIQDLDSTFKPPRRPKTASARLLLDSLQVVASATLATQARIVHEKSRFWKLTQPRITEGRTQPMFCLASDRGSERQRSRRRKERECV